ncbi:MAG: hypothetical protein AAF231_03595 [Pseudomonadota bacterium]
MQRTEDTAQTLQDPLEILDTFLTRVSIGAEAGRWIAQDNQEVAQARAEAVDLDAGTSNGTFQDEFPDAKVTHSRPSRTNSPASNASLAANWMIQSSAMAATTSFKGAPTMTCWMVGAAMTS